MLVEKKLKTVLCIDDEPIVLMCWAELIESGGYRVLTADGGTEAIKLFRHETIHAVILDYEMPGMNGGAVAAEIRRLNRKVPIILHTGGSKIGLEELALFDRVVSKDASLSAMLNAIEAVVLSGVGYK
jgi:CheY-like chemotaxis protein